MHSDCVVKQGNLPSDCLKYHSEELPEECQSLRKATFECKRGMVRLVRGAFGSFSECTLCCLAGYEETLPRERCWFTV
jgi:hypothetical protein